jgi:hypothetical protein
LIETYPEAKVIYTTRDVDSWYASVLKTVDWRANDPELRAISQYDWSAGLYYPMLRKFWDCFFSGDFKLNGKRRYHEYYAELKTMTPPENLFEFRIEEGWGPLCAYLGQPIPDVPFPNSNSRDNFVTRCRTQNYNQMRNVLFRLLSQPVQAPAFWDSMLSVKDMVCNVERWLVKV